MILLLVLFSCTVNGGDPESSPTKNPETGETALPGESDTLEPDDKPSEKDSDEPEVVDDDIVPAANTGVTFIPAGNVPSGSTPTCELDPSACEDTRPPGAGVDICEIRPDLTQCQEPEPPTTPPTDPTDPPTEEPEPPLCELFPDLPICGEDPGPGDPEDENAPDPVTLSGCDVLTNTSVKIDWSKAQDKSGISHYTVTSSPDAGNPGRTEDTAATFTGLDAGVTYTFSVTATDKAGNESQDSNEIDCVMDVTAPQIPQDVTVEAGDPSDSTLNVSWSESEDNENGVDDVTYNLYRNGKLVGPVNDTSYEDTGLEAGKEYTYTVTAVDGAGNESDQSAGATGKTTKIAPTVPQNVKVDNASALGFDVSWSASTDEDDKTPQGEIVYIVRVQGGILCLPQRSEPGATSMRVGCLLGQDSTVTVTAEDGDGNQSAPSDPARDPDAQPRGDDGNATLRSNTPGEDKSDAPADKPGSPEAPAEDAPADEQPSEENSPLLPGLDDILPGGDDAAEAPAEEPAEPEATPSESESPAARPTTEEPADEATEDAPAEEDEGGLLDSIGDALTSAVAAVF
ncbi:fibronectin type III domain-containing protein [Nocardioides sp. NPDC057577]|uniref:fibronectin type III domain-containing protein n=1 Tax=Nocardioides sp. NPDC057577 TaxID=3346171 RepID=UPI0036728971